jgi:hypothetical protein
MSHNTVEAALGQLRSAETTMGRMLNVLEGMQQERQAATQLSTSIGVMNRLMGDVLAEREELINEVVSCREALRHRDALFAQGQDLLGQVAELREANRELTERLRDTTHRLDLAERDRRQAEARLQDGHDRLLGAPTPGSLPLVNLPADGTTLKDIEFEAIVQALTRSYMLQNRAAALLGISERAMSYRCAHVYRDRLKPRVIAWRGAGTDDEFVTDDTTRPDESLGADPVPSPPPDPVATFPCS